MPTFTTKIQWRSGTPNKTKNSFVGLLKDHFQNSNVAWTVLDDQSSSATNPYIVVTKNRGTGFSGDNIVALLKYVDSQGYLYIRSFSSWDAINKVGANGDLGGEPSATRYLPVSTSSDMDFFISTDSTFIAATCKIGSPLVNQSRLIIAISAFERYAGDSDTGTFFGGWELPDSSKIYPPTIGGQIQNSYFTCSTILGGITSLNSVNEAGNDVLLPLYAHRADICKHKGQIYGLRMTTNSASLADGTITSSVDGTSWMIVKNGNQGWAMAVGTGGSLNTVS